MAQYGERQSIVNHTSLSLLSLLSEPILVLSIQFDASLHIRFRLTDCLESIFRSFRAKANEIDAFPNHTICLTVFLLIVWRRRLKRNPQ